MFSIVKDYIGELQNYTKQEELDLLLDEICDLIYLTYFDLELVIKIANELCKLKIELMPFSLRENVLNTLCVILSLYEVDIAINTHTLMSWKMFVEESLIEYIDECMNYCKKAFN